MSLTVKSLLSRDEQSFAAVLDKYLKDNHGTQLRVLYKTTPAAFVDPFQQDDGELRSACFLSILDFVITANVVKGSPRVALLSADNANRFEIEKIFERRYLPIVVIDPVGNDFSQVISEIKAILSQRPRVKFEGPGNSSELWLKNIAKNAIYNVFEGYWARRQAACLDPDVFDARVFMEPCLAEFITIPIDSDDPIHNYGRTARSDVLVTKNGENLTPLLALEFDGPTHDEPHRQASDEKKEALFEEAGIPLLRIRWSNVPFQLVSSTGNVVPLSSTLNASLTKYLFEDIFTKVVSALTLNAHFEKIDMPEIWNEYEKKRSAVIAEQISEVKQRYPSEIPEHVINIIFDAVNRATEDELSEARARSEVFIKSALGDISFFNADDLLGMTQSILDIQSKHTQEESGARRAVLTTPAGIWTITVPRIDLQYLAPESSYLYSNSSVNFSLYPEFAYSEIVEELIASTFHRLASHCIEKHKVPKLISKRELDQYREFWRRPKSTQEKEFLDACSVLWGNLVYQSLSPEDQAEVDSIRNFDLDSELGLKPRESIASSLPVVTKLPTLYEYAEKFNRSPCACLSYPGVKSGLIERNASVLSERKDMRSLERKFRQEEVLLAIDAKSAGLLPRHLN